MTAICEKCGTGIFWQRNGWKHRRVSGRDLRANPHMIEPRKGTSKPS